MNKIKIKQIENLQESLDIINDSISSSGDFTNGFEYYEQSSTNTYFYLSGLQYDNLSFYYKIDITDNYETKILLPLKTGDNLYLTSHDGQSVFLKIDNLYSGFNQPISFHTGYFPFGTGDFSEDNKIFTFSGQITGEDYSYIQEANFVYNLNDGISSQKWETFSYNGMKL